MRTVCSGLLTLVCAGIVWGDDDSGVAAWQREAGRLRQYRAAVQVHREPSPRMMEILSTQKFAQAGNPLAGSYARIQGTVLVSRMDRLGRYVISEQQFPLLADRSGRGADADDLFSKSPMRHEHTEVHGASVFAYYDPETKVGSVWSRWPHRPQIAVDWIQPPGEDFQLVGIRPDEKGQRVAEYRNEREMRRYFLNPDQAGMPSKIEYFHLYANADPFEYRFVVIDSYQKRDDGLYVPAQSTMYDFVHPAEDGSLVWEMEERHTIEDFSVSERFDEDEFRLIFPQGARVHDHIAEVTYLVAAHGPVMEKPYDENPSEALDDYQSRLSPSLPARDHSPDKGTPAAQDIIPTGSTLETIHSHTRNVVIALSAIAFVTLFLVVFTVKTRLHREG